MRHQRRKISQRLRGHVRLILKFPNQSHRYCLPSIGLRYYLLCGKLHSISFNKVALLDGFVSQVTFLYLDSPNEDFVAVAETVLLTLRLAGIKVQATHTWDTVYHHGYMKNPFDELVEKTYIDTRSTYNFPLNYGISDSCTA